MSDLTIGAVAKSAGVGVETIRFYERQKLIEQPAKPSSGFRRYSTIIVKRVRFIQQAKELGFSLREIRELLDLSLDPGRNCNEVRDLAETKLAAIEGRIESLEKIKGALSQLIVACDARNPTQACPIIESIIGEAMPDV